MGLPIGTLKVYAKFISNDFDSKLRYLVYSNYGIYTVENGVSSKVNLNPNEKVTEDNIDRYADSRRFNIIAEAKFEQGSLSKQIYTTHSYSDLKYIEECFKRYLDSNVKFVYDKTILLKLIAQITAINKK